VDKEEAHAARRQLAEEKKSFAADLRALRQAHGSTSYRDLAKASSGMKAPFSHGAGTNWLSGGTTPSPEHTVSLLRAITGAEAASELVTTWKRRSAAIAALESKLRRVEVQGPRTDEVGPESRTDGVSKVRRLVAGLRRRLAYVRAIPRRLAASLRRRLPRPSRGQMIVAMCVSAILAAVLGTVAWRQASTMFNGSVASYLDSTAAFSVYPPIIEADVLAASPGGTVLAAGGGDFGGQVAFWALHGCGAPRQLGAQVEPTGNSPVTAIAFSPDGASAAIGLQSGGFEIWSVAAAGPAMISRPTDTGLGQIVALSFSPDGRTLAVAGRDGLSLWNLARPSDPVPGQRLATVDVPDAAFDPAADVLAAGTSDGRVLLWNIDGASGTPMASPGLPSLGINGIKAVGFSPNGGQMAIVAAPSVTGSTPSTADGEFVLFAAADTQNIYETQQMKAPVSAFAFSPEADGIATIADGATSIRLLQDADLQAPYDELDASASSMGFTSLTTLPKTSCVATLDQDGDVAAWNMIPFV
jgi:WD40 repeat protein